MAIKNVVIRYQKPVSLARPNASSVLAGYAQPGTDTTTTIQAAVQPLSAKELRDLPPGQNAIDWRNFWSLSELRIKDKITVGGITYRLKNAVYWPEGEFWQGQGSKVSDTL